ncbi:Response regulator receiver protein [Candidatus Sulfopaludibacter sp. SbA3]|nr:Response regulator receiver protein [Candidatus Sulfopaludibacter sp. SbA3]
MARILVADDDLEQVTLRKQMLEAGGHRVDIALCAEATLLQVGLGDADLVIMDLRFPESSDGLALIRHIREMGCRKPVIVLSGWPEDLYEQPEESMVSRVMVKPVPMVELLEAVASAVA